MTYRYDTRPVILRPLVPDELEPELTGYYAAYSLHSPDCIGWGKGLENATRQARLTFAELSPAPVLPALEFWTALRDYAEEQVRLLRGADILPFAPKGKD